MLGRAAPEHRPSRRILDALLYVQFADAFGWTPRQIDEDVPAWLIPYIVPVLNQIREVQESERERRSAPANGGAGGP